MLAETANVGTGMTRSCYTVLGCAGFKVQGVGFRIDVEDNVLGAVREHQRTNYMADIVSGLGLKVFKNFNSSYCDLRPLRLLNWVDLVAGSGRARNFRVGA